MFEKSLQQRIEYFTQVLEPETELEQRLLRDPAFLAGLQWGFPRYGHPEGEVYKHIQEVLENINRIPTDSLTRQRLRLIAYAHDTFKHLEHKGTPRDWSQHHSILARNFLEKYCTDRVVLEITELHDEAYYAWRMEHLYHQFEAGQARLQALLQRLGDQLQLYYLFFKCDTRTGDKTQAPLRWFEQTIKNIEVVEF